MALSTYSRPIISDIRQHLADYSGLAELANRQEDGISALEKVAIHLCMEKGMDIGILAMYKDDAGKDAFRRYIKKEFGMDVHLS